MPKAGIDGSSVVRRSRARRLAGLYAVTPDLADTRDLVARVTAALEGGACAIQYRNKSADPALRRVQAAALAQVHASRGGLYIVNDDAALALAVDADGVHVGADDGSIAAARDRVGPDRIVGVSCYDDFARAQAAVAAGADYVAFGSFFASATKPGARRADIGLLARAKALGVPIVAIGGITADNARTLARAGADAVAVISAVFDVPDVKAAASAIAGLFALPQSAAWSCTLTGPAVHAPESVTPSARQRDRAHDGGRLARSLAAARTSDLPDVDGSHRRCAVVAPVTPAGRADVRRHRAMGAPHDRAGGGQRSGSTTRAAIGRTSRRRRRVRAIASRAARRCGGAIADLSCHRGRERVDADGRVVERLCARLQPHLRCIRNACFRCMRCSSHAGSSTLGMPLRPFARADRGLGLLAAGRRAHRFRIRPVRDSGEPRAISSRRATRAPGSAPRTTRRASTTR